MSFTIPTLEEEQQLARAIEARQEIREEFVKKGCLRKIVLETQLLSSWFDYQEFKEDHPEKVMDKQIEMMEAELGSSKLETFNQELAKALEVNDFEAELAKDLESEKEEVEEKEEGVEKKKNSK